MIAACRWGGNGRELVGPREGKSGDRTGEERGAVLGGGDRTKENRHQ